MKYIFKKIKTRGKEYLQIWKGNSTTDMVYIRSLGTADKLVKQLQQLDELIELTNKMPNILTEFQEWKKNKLTKKE